MNYNKPNDVPEVQLFDLETLKDPYPAYKNLRDDAPVFYVPAMNIHVVTRYDLRGGEDTGADGDADDDAHPVDQGERFAQGWLGSGHVWP